MKNFRKMWVIRSLMVLILILMLALIGVAYLYRPMLSYVLIPILAVVAFYTVRRYRNLHQEIYQLVRSMDHALLTEQTQSTFDLPIPALIVSRRGEILWHNSVFTSALAQETLFGARFNRIFNITVQEIKEDQGQVITYRGRKYRTYVVSALNNNLGNHLIQFVDVTEMYEAQQEFYLSRPVVVVILIDSYEEIVKNAKESEKTHILSEINRLLEQYIGKTTGFLKRLEWDRYMAVIEKRHFDLMLEDRFSILEDTKNIMTNERVPITLSIGVGYEGETLTEKERDAHQALDMALGRGGDQVALKIEGGFKFFGGASKGVEIRTKVKSRIIASAMAELIYSADNILIMGHKFSDLDCIGSAIGLARACVCVGRDAKIVIDEQRTLAHSLVDYYRQQDDQEDLFLSPAAAEQTVRRGTLLFVVDTHSKNFLESPEIYQNCRDVVVVDHHRKTVDFIDNAVVFYHEPYASSTSEMVTELVQYLDDNCSLLHYHAEALLSGIMLDTKNFIMKTGVRTFEAAAYLKKCGADTVKVRKMFAGSMDDYRNKTRLVSSAELYQNCAVAIADQEIGDVRIVASQAADDLLGINGVDASFVIYKDGKGVSVSGRSMGNMNVQIMMEEMGGGGHLTMAAAQLTETDCEIVRQQLFSVIDHYNDLHTRAKEE